MTQFDDILKTLKDHAKGRFYYMGCPYSNKDPRIVNRNLNLSMSVCGQLIARGLIVHHPTFTAHHLAYEYKFPTNFEFWVSYNQAFIDASCGFIVCQTPGWHQSRGLAYEMEYVQDRPKFTVVYAKLHSVSEIVELSWKPWTS